MTKTITTSILLVSSLALLGCTQPPATMELAIQAPEVNRPARVDITVYRDTEVLAHQVLAGEELPWRGSWSLADLGEVDVMAAGYDANGTLVMQASRTIALSHETGVRAELVLAQVSQVMKLFPSGFDFGEQPLGAAPVATFVIENASGTPVPPGLHIEGSQLFVLESTCGTLQPGATCTFRVRLDAGAVGLQQARLVAGDAVVPLSAKVLKLAVLGMEPGELPLLGEPGVTVKGAVQLHNRGAEATLLDISLESDGAVTLAGHDCGNRLAAGASCTIEVRFQPDGTPHRARLTARERFDVATIEISGK